MNSLRRTVSVDSFEVTRRDAIQELIGHRSESLIGTLDSDPILAYHMPRIENGITIVTRAKISYRNESQEVQRKAPFHKLRDFFWPKKEPVYFDYTLSKRRGTRLVKDARTTITKLAREREHILSVCRYAFGEVYIPEFDEGGPRFTVKLQPEKLPTSEKECVYEKSRILRYLSLRIMSTSGLFSVYHQAGDIKAILKTLDETGRKNVTRMGSRLGASLEYKAITKEIMRLLDDTIHLQETRSILVSTDLIRLAERTILCCDVLMHLHVNEVTAAKAHREKLDKLMSSWRDAFEHVKWTSENSAKKAEDDTASISMLLRQHLQKSEYNYSLLKEDLYRELKLEVLFSGPPSSLGLRCTNQEAGAYGSIDKCLLSDPKRFSGVPWPISELAVKTIRVPSSLCKQEATKIHCKRVIRELRAWSKMKNDRIVPILGIWEDKEPDTLLCAVSPWISGGQLDHYLLRTQPKRIDALCLMHDIASGLDYMHNMNPGVVHGDLKPDNVLVRDGRAFITDFGLSHIMDDVSGFTSQVHGHPMWLAPEAIIAKCQLGSEKQSFKPTFAQDMYSFGCLFLFVVHRQMPFGMLGDSPGSIYISREKRMHEAPITKKDGLRFGIDDYQLMLECWRIDPMLRITARLSLQNVGRLLDTERYGSSNHVEEVPFPRQITLASKRGGNVTEGSSSCFQFNSRQTSYVPSKTRPSLSECPELAFGLVTWRKQCWVEGGRDR